MKKVKNLYEKIVDIKKLELIYKQVKNNTKNKLKLEKFENNYVSNMVLLKNKLENNSYKVGKYNIFLIKEPKVRIIMSQSISDKIINHLVSKYFLIDIFDKTLIDTNVATRKNKGTHYGMKKLKKYLNEIKVEQFYILKFDIKKYFYNLDHDIIKQLISNKIKDEKVLKILFDIIDSTNELYVNETIRKIKKSEFNKSNNKEIEDLPEYKYKKGLPIGNMSSQILAILYLNELDHFIKQQLKIKYYIRYMDDGILLHKDKFYLEYCLEEIKKIIKKYKLELNNKTKIINSKNGFNFLGFHYFVKNNKIIIKTKNQTKKRFKRKIKKLNKLVENKQITKTYLKQVTDSYIGHLQYGHTKNLIRKTLKKDYQKLKVSNVKIINNQLIYQNEIIYYK